MTLYCRECGSNEVEPPILWCEECQDLELGRNNVDSKPNPPI